MRIQYDVEFPHNYKSNPKPRQEKTEFYKLLKNFLESGHDVMSLDFSDEIGWGGSISVYMSQVSANYRYAIRAGNLPIDVCVRDSTIYFRKREV